MPYRPKNSQNWHFDFQVKGRRFCGSCGTSDFEEAKQVEAEARVRAKAGVATRKTFTVSQALGTYWSEVSQHQTCAATTQSQAKMILKVIPGTTHITDLNNQTLAKFVARRRAEVSNATVNRQLQLLGRAIRYMARVYDAETPDLDFKGLETKEPRRRVRELSYSEQDALFGVLRPDLIDLARGALLTGQRRGELIGLKRSQILSDQIRFDVKGDRDLFFPIYPELGAFLSTLPASNVMAARSFVFTYVNKLNGDRLPFSEGGGIWEDWRSALREAGIANFRFHDLRHTFATRLLRKSRNIALVSQLLGHSDIETTMLYAHVLDDDKRAGLADFSALSDGESRSFSRSKNAD